MNPINPNTKNGQRLLAIARQSAACVGCNAQGYIFAIGDYDAVRKAAPVAKVMEVAVYDECFPAPVKTGPRKRKGPKLMVGPGCTY